MEEWLSQFSPEQFNEWVALDIVDGEERALLWEQSLSLILAAQGMKDVEPENLEFLRRLTFKDHRTWLDSATS